MPSGNLRVGAKAPSFHYVFESGDKISLKDLLLMEHIVKQKMVNKKALLFLFGRKISQYMNMLH